MARLSSIAKITAPTMHCTDAFEQEMTPTLHWFDSRTASLQQTSHSLTAACRLQVCRVDYRSHFASIPMTTLINAMAIQTIGAFA